MKLTPEQSEAIINERLEKTKHLLIVKGKEYQRNNDRLHNFRRAAEVQRSNMPRALQGMLLKHIISYLDILDDIDKGIIPNESAIDEKVGDMIVYLHLQEVAIKEQIRIMKEEPRNVPPTAEMEKVTLKFEEKK